ncbi:MAG: AmmeMemoRadiSam system protein B [Candidatus Peregrinibacteria bacterium]|nr:AmmeMemoRadiSam system protein B [Candidatus Peregrinibacteria bacterium]
MKLQSLLNKFSSRNKAISALASAGVLIGIITLFATSHQANSQDFNTNHTKTFFEEGDFYRGIKEKNLFTLDMPIYGGILPHHLIPSDGLNTYFSQLQKQNPKRIILISPNHFLRGNTNFITSPYGYNTPFGSVHIDQDLYKKITDASAPTEQKLDISRNDEAMNMEHGIGNLTAYIRYYLPKTTIMPIAVMPTTTSQQIDNLVAKIAPLIDRDTIFLASIDFSHYLPAEIAAQKDETTWKLIQERDYNRILNLNNNDYLDTPPSLVTMLKTMERIGAKNMKQLYHNNSGFIMHDMTMPTTSYFMLSFTK